ncbi:MAG: outer membrane protein [Alphaproteobacteria bacterium]
MKRKNFFILLIFTTLVLQGVSPGFCMDNNDNGSTGSTPFPNFHIGGSMLPPISTASSSKSQVPNSENVLRKQLLKIRAARAPDSSFYGSSQQSTSDGSEGSFENPEATSGANPRRRDSLQEQATTPKLSRSSSDPGQTHFALDTQPSPGLVHDLREALQRREEERLAAAFASSSDRQEPSGFTTWGTNWDTSSDYVYDQQGQEGSTSQQQSFSSLRQLELNFAGEDLPSSTPKKPPIPPKPAAEVLAQRQEKGRQNNRDISSDSEASLSPPLDFSSESASDFVDEDLPSSKPQEPPVPAAQPLLDAAADALGPAPVVPAPPLPNAAAAPAQQRPPKLSAALKGINGGVFVGYGKQWERFYLGLEATYILSNEKANLNNLAFRKKNTAEVAIRSGFVLGNTLFYGKLGVLSSQFKLADQSLRFNGLSLGCGADMKLSPKTLLGLSYTCELYGKKKYIDQNNASLNLKPTSHRVMLRIGYRF